MIKNTLEENELLKRLKEIEDVIEAKRNSDDYRLSIDVQHKIESVLEQVKITYPTVKYPISLINGGCGTCFASFIQDMIPVYDRLSSQQENEVDEDPDAEFYKQLFELPEGTHLIEVKESNEPKELIELIVDQTPENRGVKSKEELTSEPEVGNVDYNANNVNQVNPFNPIGHDDVEEIKEFKDNLKAVFSGKKGEGKIINYVESDEPKEEVTAPAKRGRKAKGK